MEKARKSTKQRNAAARRKAPAKQAARKLVRAAAKSLGALARNAKPALVAAKNQKHSLPRSTKSAQVIPFEELLELKNQKAHTKLRTGVQGFRHK